MFLLYALSGMSLPYLGQAGETPWGETRLAGEYVRSFLPDPTSVSRLKGAGNLAGQTGGCCITGWVEYDFNVPRTGWYELSVDGNGHEVEYLLNPGKDGTPQWYEYGSSGNVIDGLDKIGNFWLATGRNTLRLQRYYWTGFPRISKVVLRASDLVPAKTVRAALSGDTSVFRARECASLHLYAGGLTGKNTVTVEVRDPSGQIEFSLDVAFPASRDLQRRSVALPCQREGDFLVSFRDKTRGWFAWRDVRGISYQVIGPANNKMPPSSERRNLVREIDLASTPPDYFGGGPTRVVEGSAGRYRETATTGFTRYQRTPDPVRLLMPEPSWFAYSLEGLTPQRLYEVEMEYPDDARRSVVIALREDLPLSYPVSGGFDSGGEFSLTKLTQKYSLLFWPRSKNVRAVVMNVHDAHRAAASRIRVFERDQPPLPPRTDHTAGRDFMHWYEEGENFLSLVGTPEPSRHEWRQEPRRIGVERWIQLAKSGGASILAPTVSIYSFTLYPSRYNRIFSRPESDDLRRILLLAEKHGLKVIPELHPRADELDWPFADQPHPRPNLLLSREGKTNFFQRDGKPRNVPPHFNPLHPSNQDWYVAMIGELADRYKDSPALKGISLRSMSWANASLNNFSSLDWGYDDFTVAQFTKETRISLPKALAPDTHGQRPSPATAEARYQWLSRHARDAWIAWRCGKIAELYTRIRDRVRLARPDLRVYSTVFAWRDGESGNQAFREAGIDPELLSRIEGVTLINAQATYGRREPEDIENQRRRDVLLRPQAFSSDQGTPAFLTSANYVEATDAVVPPERIGFPPNTKRTWASAALVPSGAHILERFAVQLAQTDALMLGDGGNGYSFGQPILWDWLREYKALPAKHFRAREDATDPVAVWTLDEGGGLFFYAVNREPYPVGVTFDLTGAGTVERLTTGARARLEEGRFTTALDSYQLVGYKAQPGMKLMRVSVRPPARKLARVTEQVMGRTAALLRQH